MSTDVVLRILAQKDASLAAITTEAKAMLVGVGQAADQAAERAKSSLSSLAQTATVSLRAVSQGLPGLAGFALQLSAGVDQVQTKVQTQLKSASDAATREAKRAADAAIKETQRAANEAEAAAERSKAAMVAASQTIGSAFEAAGRSLLGLVGYAVQVAGSFEQLQAKLQTVKGSFSEAQKTFQNAVAYAAQTPFDVQGIVAATVTLESFKVKSETVLPRVAALAAGMGKGIVETGLVIGKAAAGSLEGFESLRNEYGITTSELHKFGAEVNETGGILTRTPAQVDKAREALLKIIDTRFGTAIERQANTFQGALSNAGDSIQSFAAAFGSSLLPGVTTGLRAFSSLADALNGALPSGFKAALAASAIFVGGLAVMAGGSTLAVTALVVLQTQLEAVTGGSLAVAAALKATTATLGAFSGAASAAKTSLLFLSTNPIGLALTAVAAITTATTLAFNAMADESRAAGLTLTETSNKAQASIQSYRELIAVLNEASRPPRALLTTGSSKDDISTVLASIKPEDLAVGMQRAGISTQDLKAKLESLGGQSESLKKEIRETVVALNDQKSAETAAAGAVANSEAEKIRGIATEAERGEQIELLSERLRGLKLNYDLVTKAIQGLSQTLNVLDSMAARLERVSRESARLGDYLNYARQIGSTQALVSAQAKLEERIVRNSKVAEVGLKSIQQLNDELLSPKFDAADLFPAIAAQKKALEAQLKALLDDASITKEIADRNKAAQDKIVEDKEDTFRREKALHGKTIDEEIAFEKTLIDLYGKQGEAGVSAQTQHIEKEAELLKKRHEDNITIIKQGVAKQIAAAKAATSIDEAGATPDKRVAAIDTFIAQIEQLRQAAIRTHPELAKLFDDTIRSAGVDRAKELAKVPAENLRILKDAIADFSSEAVNTAQKLDAVERAIALTRKAQAAGLVDDTLAKRELVTLTRQQADLERQITAEKNQRQSELRSLELQAKEQELQSLQSRRDAGETKAGNGQDINRTIKESFKERLKLELDNIQKNSDAQIAAARGDADAIADIQKNAELNKSIAMGKETQRIYDELQQRTQKFGQEMDKQDSRFQKSQQNANPSSSDFGGRNSPFSTQAQFGSPFQTSDLPDFGTGFGRSFYRNSLPTPPNFNQIAAQVKQQTDAATKQSGPITDAAAHPLDAKGNQFNNTINVQGQVINFNDPDFNAAVLRVLKANESRTKRLGGPNKPGLVDPAFQVNKK